MSPTFSLGKSGRRYRYYVSTTLQQGDLAGEDDIPRRIPAPPLEVLLASRLKALIPTIKTLDQAVECGLLRRVEALPESLLIVLRTDALPRWTSDPEACFLALQRQVKADERLWRAPHEASDLKFSIAVSPRLNSGRTTLVGVANKLLDSPPQRDHALIQALRAAHERVAQASDPAGAGMPIRTQHDRHIMQLAFLAPDIQRAILDGRQPKALTLRQLRSNQLPTVWSEQRAAFGF